MIQRGPGSEVAACLAENMEVGLLPVRGRRSRAISAATTHAGVARATLRALQVPPSNERRECAATLFPPLVPRMPQGGAADVGEQAERSRGHHEKTSRGTVLYDSPRRRSRDAPCSTPLVFSGPEWS